MSQSSPLRIAIAPCFMHPDPNRNLFQGKRLLYTEEETVHWVLENGPALCPEGLRAYTLPSPPASLERDEDHAAMWLDDFDALLLQGGADVAPSSYGQEPMDPRWGGDPIRDRWESLLIRAAVARGLPILGLCRGVQILNVALGGTLLQDIPTQRPSSSKHRDPATYDSNVHDVHIHAGGWLDTLFGGPQRLRVNSVHHQAIDTPAPGAVVEATSCDDRIIEAISWHNPKANPNEPQPLVAGVQWHPEWCRPERGVPTPMTPILASFLSSARTQKTTRTV